MIKTERFKQCNFKNPIIREENSTKKHYLVDYDDVSRFYANTTVIKAGEKFSVGVYQNDENKKPILKLNLKPVIDESGVLKAKIDWKKIPKIKQSRVVFIRILNEDKEEIYNAKALMREATTTLQFSATAVKMVENKGAVMVGTQALGKMQTKECEKLYWGIKFTCEERKKIREICLRLNCNPNYLTSAMALETGGKFDPSVVNSLGYTGLIQIGSTAASDINRRKKTSITAGKGGTLSKMSVVEQLTYVEYYLEPFKGKLKTLADFYLAILMPVDCGKGNDKNHIVFDKNLTLDYNNKGEVIKNTKWVRQRAYSQNPVFFKEGKKEDGKTYVWEIAEEIEKWYEKGESNQHTCIKNCPLKNPDNKITNLKWHDPIDNPEITMFNFYGDYKPEGSSFGLVRNGGTKNHQGLDIFAPKGTPVKACLKGKVVSVSQNAGDFGKFIIIEVSKKDLDDSRQNYTLKYTGEKEKGSDFGDSDKRYLRYGHLSETSVVNNQEVNSGDIIGKSGNTGNALNQSVKARHLHFEITDSVTAGKGLNNRENPSFYVRLKSGNKDKQEKNKE